MNHQYPASLRILGTLAIGGVLSERPDALELFGINLIHQTLKMSRERAVWQGIFDSSLSRNTIGARAVAFDEISEAPHITQSTEIFDF